MAAELLKCLFLGQYLALEALRRNHRSYIHWQRCSQSKARFPPCRALTTMAEINIMFTVRFLGEGKWSIYSTDGQIALQCLGESGLLKDRKISRDQFDLYIYSKPYISSLNPLIIISACTRLFRVVQPSCRRQRSLNIEASKSSNVFRIPFRLSYKFRHPWPIAIVLFSPISASRRISLSLRMALRFSETQAKFLQIGISHFLKSKCELMRD